MPDIDQIYASFVQSWQAGELPDLDSVLERAAPEQRDELAERIETFVMLAPSVGPTPERAAEIRASPAFAAAADLATAPDALPWPVRLRTARERAGLSLAELGERFVAAFELEGREEKATTLLGELESGERSASGVSRRAGERLAELLGLAGDALTAPPAVQPIFRAHVDLEDPGTSQGPPPEFAAALDAALGVTGDWDAVDDLLLGGDLDED